MNEKQENITIETKDFRFELKEYTPLTRLVLDMIIEWLKQEAEEHREIEKTKYREDELAKLDMYAINKPVKKDMDVMGKPMDIKKQKKEKSEKKKTKYVMDKSLLLKRYGNVSVWKPIVDFIFDNVSGEFTREDVVKLVSKGYKTVLKRKIKPSSASVYTTGYIRWMKEDSSPLLIERCDDPNISPVVLYRKIKSEVTEEPLKEPPPEPELKEKEKPVEKEPKKKIVLSKAAKDIYDLAKEKNWVVSGLQINVKHIERYLEEYSLDEIKGGLAELIEEKKLWQPSPDKVKFK